MGSIEVAAGLEAVEPARPVAPYVGGKRNLAARLAERIATVPHTLYAEPFVGMGGVFFRRRWRPKAEVINDISADVVTLFRLLQRHPHAFLDELKWTLSSRAEFERLMQVDPDTLTDIERAGRFLYLQRLAFGGKVVGRNFGVSRTAGGRFDITRLRSMLEDVHERLAGVVIERMHWADFLRRYDAPGTLFYLDPPYWGSADYYGPTFSHADYEAMRGALEALEGRWIMSINDVPDIRVIFAGCAIEEAGHHFRLGGRPSEARELIISRLG